MKKLHKFLKVGLPIIGTAVVGASAAVGIGLSVKKTSSKKLSSSNKILNAQAEDQGISAQINTHLPSICSKWGTIALVPEYPKNVIEKFGGTYDADGNGAVWPHLFANSVSKQDILSGNVKDEDLLTFDQMMPNTLLAKLIAEDTLNMHSSSTILHWLPNPDKTSAIKGRWINYLAETTNAKVEYKTTKEKEDEWQRWQTQFNARATFQTAANNDNNSQTTCRDVDKLLCSVLMNPFLYDSTMYSNDNKNIFEPAYNHIYNWDLSNNFFTTLPKGMFKYMNLADTSNKNLLYLQDGFILNFESSYLCAFNPMELFGDRKENSNETWETRNTLLGDGNDKFDCKVYFNISRSKINPHQDSWQYYAGQDTKNTLHKEVAKYGWNFTDNGALWINTLNNGVNEWKAMEYNASTQLPDCGPIPINPEGDPEKNPENYGLGPDDTAHISDVVMTALTDHFKHSNIWASNEVYQIVLDTLDCIVDMDWISLPTGKDVYAKGKADDINGECSITIDKAAASTGSDIKTTFDITGFNESKSALILAITLTIIFVLVLAFSINSVYRNFHPKLSKDELQLINEVNSTNRLNKIRKLQEQRQSREESKTE